MSVENIMKRCQIGFPRHLSHHDAIHDLLAECYRTLGAQENEIDRLTAELQHATECMCGNKLSRGLCAMCDNDE